MDLSMVKTGGHRLGRILYRNSPTILTWLGVSGFVTTVVMAIKVTPKAERLIEEAKLYKEKDYLLNNRGVLNFDEKDAIRRLSKLEVIKATWKVYLPVAALGSVSIVCFIGANSINLRRNAAIASLYSATRKAFDEYQQKVVEQIGRSKEEKIREDLVQDKLDKNPVDDKQVLVTGKGEQLCYDSWSGRYFYSDPEIIRRSANEFNRRLITDLYRPLNEWYDMLGLEPIKAGDDIGWVVQRGLLEVNFTTRLVKDERACLVLEYGRNGPSDLSYP